MFATEKQNEERKVEYNKTTSFSLCRKQTAEERRTRTRNKVTEKKSEKKYIYILK